MNTTEYYGAEIQDVQVQIAVAVLPATTETRIVYSFSQKVLADTYIIKYVQSASSSIKSKSTTATLNYTPIVLQLGRGGPNAGNLNNYIKSLYPSYDVSDFTYDDKNLYKFTSMTNISTSPAADLVEVTATFSLILSANIIYVTATPKS